ncbi:MAG: GNAT family N-acetyltransferase, partial [Burkholderiaceae bacterium]
KASTRITQYGLGQTHHADQFFVVVFDVDVVQSTRLRRIGTQLLDWAKTQSTGKLWLLAFARNAIACAFYEKHGFKIIARGFEPNWQLADIKYQWTATDAVV